MTTGRRTFSAADRVVLGGTGIEVSRLAIGSGTNGGGQQSRQTRLGLPAFTSLILRAYERGITFWDAADQYGSHPFFKKALEQIRREEVVILTKSITGRDPAGIRQDVDRFRQELDTDYIDILLLHGLTEADWEGKYWKALEFLAQAKEKGIIRAHGVSCHSLAALQKAAAIPWTDVIMARLNYAGCHMDGAPREVVPLLQSAHRAGKGIVAMKILGCGLLARRLEAALQFVLGLDCLDAFSVGFESQAELEDLLHRLEQIIVPEAQPGKWEA
ncbi:MAG: aldo/keto reductase [Deltaproteobacteria bacterium]|nr:aldo/keto reductase [Deltaproteobacteria bacterium]